MILHLQDVFLLVIHHSVLNSKHQPEVGSIAAGGSFGELALLYFAPRAATIQANAKAIWCADSIDVHRTNPSVLIDEARDACAVWVIDRKHFKDGCALSQQMRKFSRLKFNEIQKDELKQTDRQTNEY